jgi:F0F1-type ATP synthase membrane subunit b/b'
MPPDLKLTAAEQKIFPYIVMSLQKHPQYRKILDHINEAEEVQQKFLEMAQKNLEIECQETVEDSCVELQSLKDDLLGELQREGNIVIDDMRNEVSQFQHDNSDALREAQDDLGLVVSGADTDLDNMITQKVRIARVRIEGVVADGVRSIQRRVNEAKQELRDVKAESAVARREPSHIQIQVAAQLDARMQQLVEAEAQFDARVTRKLADAGAQIDAMVKQKLAGAGAPLNGTHNAADILSGGLKIEQNRNS